MTAGVLSAQTRRSKHIGARGASRRLCGALAGLALALLVALSTLATLATPPAHAAPAASQANRPTEAVAYARVAVVRVLSYYYGKTTSSGPIPVLSPCIGDGALIGTTGPNLNSFSYALIPTALVNPITPCQGVQTAFAQFSGQAANWGLIRIQVDLNVAYTGVGLQQQGSVVYTIDPSQIRTTGAPAGPQLLALPLGLANGSPNHDLPGLQTPQPSDAPADPANNTLIDLTGQTGALLNASALTPGQLSATLYPVALPATQAFPGADQPTASSTATVAPTATSSAQAQQIATQLSLGAVEVDGNGRLIGMVGADSQGNHILYSASDMQRTIGGVTGKPGVLMTQWKQGLDAFYASPPQYSAAQSAFNGLVHAYPDFGGAQPFASAAARNTGAIPALTSAGATPTGPNTPGTPGGSGLSKFTLALIGALALLLLALAGGVAVALMRRRRAIQRALALAAPSPEEAQLDLLPPDMPLDAVPEDDEPTRPITRVELNSALSSAGAGVVGATSIADMATAHLSATPRASASRASTATRKTSILTAQTAGMIDPGIKRMNEPNQDNIFALEGVRAEGGRLHPYSLLIVADGMGGHLNGQLASRLTIEIVARTVAHALSSSQPFDRDALSQLLVEGAQLAHQELQRRNHEQNSDMGTTITAALVVDDHAYIVNVGDSRTYLLNDAGLRQITHDHSVVASLVSAGVIRPEDIYIHPRRNQIYRSLGGDESNLEVDTFEEELQAGDKLLLCSDGLWEMVRDPQMANILRGAANPRQAVELLTREANANGGEDNVGVVVARLREGLAADAQPGMRMVAGPQDAPPEGA
ncbi:MAG TPA: protein phosphatase 2C domain-containing protein [Ktedonobacterales bacterium]|jgi:serine/threonine protein phosphatase PrpC|nr:protein phosphatase 2C domain-containing protein [Ktedonobacterales bacterium]